MNSNRPNIIFKVIKYLFALVAGLFVFSIAWALLYKFVPVYYTPLMVVRSFEYDDKTPFKRQWVPFSEISRNVKRMVIRAEDHKFYEHSGFDFEAIKFAMEHNRKYKHKNKKGASTISQQTAKNVFLWPSRSWVRKGLEAYFTVLIEVLWSKERILEVYLNVIELGPNVYGVEAAAKKFYKKSAKNINVNEAALMAAVLPNPRRYRIDRPGPYVLKRQRILMGKRAVPKIEPEAKIEIVPEIESEEILEEKIGGKLDDELLRELEELNQTGPGDLEEE